MGYTTEFRGVLKFKDELTGSQLAFLNTIVGEDCRDHPEWNEPDLYCIDLRLTEDFSGLEWNETEKTYNMDQLVNVVIHEMQKKYPDFQLTGKLLAQGEDLEDRWELIIEDGLAIRKSLPLVGQIITCPYCDSEFELKE